MLDCKRISPRSKRYGLYWLCIAGIIAGLTGLSFSADGTESSAGAVALVVQIRGPIGPATADFVSKAIGTAQSRSAALVVLTMDTPGGLSDSMRDIIHSILEAPLPVVGYVFPSGSRAASAGTYILYACHIAAMAPGTNLGAATPIQIGGGLPLPGQNERPSDESQEPSDQGKTRRDALTAKIVNDAAAYIRSLAQMRGRNAEWAERSVREGVSLAVADALAESVIDLVAADIADLLRQLDGRQVTVAGSTRTLKTDELRVETIEPDWRNRLLSVLTNPNIAFLLILAGIYGLFFEFANPGTIGPGVVGVICLMLGFYALNLLPINYAGLGLLILAIALMAAEAFSPSFGVLGTGGIIAFVLSATMLIDSGIPGFSISWPVILTTAAMSAGLLIFLLGYVWRAQRRPVTTGGRAWIGKAAVVLEWSAESGSGYVRCGGERWRAAGPADLTPDEGVFVHGRSGLRLDVGRTAPKAKGDRHADH
ncbi:MAG: nodulation protein NfeD [Desulfosarcinaceae bacterium]|nr:nodulation protein NfeD [Desulfosarcinaceae bacterium]